MVATFYYFHILLTVYKKQAKNNASYGPPVRHGPTHYTGISDLSSHYSYILFKSCQKFMKMIPTGLNFKLALISYHNRVQFYVQWPYY